MFGAETSSAKSTARRPAIESDAADVSTNVGVMVAHSPTGNPDALEALAERAVSDARGELQSATGIEWRFHVEEAERLSDGNRRRPSDFLEEATLRMVEGPYDAFLVVTDVPLRSRRRRVVPGLASPVSRVAVVSTRTLVTTPRGEPVRSLDAEAVRWNAAALALHLFAHVLGARHGGDGVMVPFRFEPDRRTAGEFGPETRRHLRQVALDIPDEADVDGERSWLGRLVFHLKSAAKNPGHVVRSLVRNRAPLLPLSLPALTTAAVAPTLILVFSAETWDVGIHLTNGDALLFGVVSVLAATTYLTAILNLFFPHEPEQALTEHMALTNVVVFCTVLVAMVGLFFTVGLLILGIELFVFPPDLMTNWPTLENPRVTSLDLLRTAAFVSTVGVLTGALAGGLEKRTVVRHLALFLKRP